MMEKNVKPGDYLKKKKYKKEPKKEEERTKEERNKLILKVILCIIFLPLVILFAFPYAMMRNNWRQTRGTCLCGRICQAILMFFIGICLNPFIIALHILGAILFLLCCCPSMAEDAETAKK